MATVYKAKLISDNSILAIKLLPFQYLTDKVVTQRFRQEAFRSRKFNHPNIIRIFEYCEDMADHFMVMELAEGWGNPENSIARDLGDLYKPMQEMVVLSIAKQACEALNYLHQNGIVHRDIKPGNLLLFANDVIKLTDFGIAKSHDGITLTLTGVTMGTPEYMSPEQAEGSGDVGPTSDIYSLGIVMYELLTGRAPFKRRRR